MLLARIQHEVRLVKIPEDQQDRVVEVIVSTLIKILTDPAVYNTLQPVMELRQENAALRQALMVATVRKQLPARKSPAKPKVKKVAPARKATAPRAPKVQVRGSTAANRKAFKEGFSGAS